MQNERLEKKMSRSLFFKLETISFHQIEAAQQVHSVSIELLRHFYSANQQDKKSKLKKPLQHILIKMKEMNQLMEEELLKDTIAAVQHAINSY